MSEPTTTGTRDKEEQETWLYLHPQGLDDGHLSIFGVAQCDHNYVPASVDDLRREMGEQRRLFELGFHPDGALCPWTGVVHLAEGAWCWDEATLDYLPLRIDEPTRLATRQEMEALGWTDSGQHARELFHPAVLRYLLANASAGRAEGD